MYGLRLTKKRWTFLLAIFFLVYVRLNYYNAVSSDGGNESIPRVVRERNSLIAGNQLPEGKPSSLRKLTFEPLEFIEDPKDNYSDIFHTYPEHVDLRIIVLTYKRSKSLSRVLDSLQDVELDGDRGSIEIWVDMGKDGAVDADTVRVARDFRWRQGSVRLHIHSQHVGLYGQWINTWRPRIHYSDDLRKTELALFVEDDIDISRYAYRWLRASYEFYKTRLDIAVFGLQDENAIIARGKRANDELNRPKGDLLFLYTLPASWGVSPHPLVWRQFQDWFIQVYSDPKFKPYVPAAPLHTSWYRTFEKQNRQDSMWTIWFLKYTNINRLFTIYSNLPTYTGMNNVSFVSNRKEDGLHFNPGMRSKWTIPKLMNQWEDKYIRFSENVRKFGYDGIEITL